MLEDGIAQNYIEGRYVDDLTNIAVQNSHPRIARNDTTIIILEVLRIVRQQLRIVPMIRLCKQITNHDVRRAGFEKPDCHVESAAVSKQQYALASYLKFQIS
jgi:hypothetical protein